MPYHLNIKNPTYAKNEEATTPKAIITIEKIRLSELTSCITPPTTTPANTSLDRSIKNLPSDCRNSLSLSFCSFLSIAYKLASHSLPFLVYVQARNAPNPTPIMINKNKKAYISVMYFMPVQVPLLIDSTRRFAPWWLSLSPHARNSHQHPF